MHIFCSFSILFFFFKQKTAYEMRISDWSSDVCSSDLIGQIVLQARGWTENLVSIRSARMGTTPTGSRPLVQRHWSITSAASVALNRPELFTGTCSGHTLKSGLRHGRSERPGLRNNCGGI